MKAKYEVAKITRCNGNVEYRIKERILFFCWRWLKDPTTSVSIDMSGGYTIDPYVFDNEDEAHDRVKEEYARDKAVRESDICKIETVNT